MPRTIHRPEYEIFCAALRSLRLRAGLSQEELAEKLGRPQTFVSAVELRKTRLDFLQIRDWCRACGTTAAKFVAQVERRLPS